MNNGLIASGASPIAMPFGLSGRTAIPMQMPADPTATPEWRVVGTTHFPKFQRALRSRIDTAVIPDTTFVSTSYVFPGGGAYSGGVLLPDGRVFLVPFNATVALIYDPIKDSFVAASGTYPGLGSLRGGVLMLDGRVYCLKASADGGQARIYDPVRDTTVLAGGAYPGSGSAFAGGCVFPDGRVFAQPNNSFTGRLYNPVTDTLSAVGSFPAADGHRSAVLLPDGRAFVVPASATTARIYDPVRNTTIVSNGVYPSGTGARTYAGGVVLADGRIFCSPGSVNVGFTMIYDPVTDSTTRTATVFGSNGWSNGAVLMADGRVFCVPGNATTPQIYNPFTDATDRVTSGGYPGSTAYSYGVLMRDGRIFCVPFNATAARIYGGRFQGLSTQPDPNVILSPYWNHNN
jgi:hypothetical protein